MRREADERVELAFSVFVIAIVASSSLSACVSIPPTRSSFKTPGISSAQWSRIDDECSYEAEKATASAKPKTAVSYTWRRLFVICAELKDAQFVGQVAMPKQELQRISELCRDGAITAIAKRPVTRSRDQLKEDLEAECLKQNGAVFRLSYYP